MTFSKLRVLAALGLAACSSVEAEPTGTATGEMTTAWFAANLPPGSQAEAAVLALANNAGMSMTSYVTRCGFSESAAAAIVSYRSGDELASSADDQRFDTLAELDALPFTDAGFWHAAKACATGAPPPPPPVCVLPPVVIELVIDQSGSMTGEKWDASRDALLTVLAELHSSGRPNLFVGALLFSTGVGRKVAPRPLNAQQYETLVDVLENAIPKGATDTLVALTAGYQAVESASANPQAKRIVVLLSDGVPSSPQAEILTLVSDQLNAGFQTFSVGIGPFPASSGYDPAFMGRIALHGGTAPTPCDPLATDITQVCHHQITPGGNVAATRGSLLAAFQSIAQSAQGSASCP